MTHTISKNKVLSIISNSIPILSGLIGFTIGALMTFCYVRPDMSPNCVGIFLGLNLLNIPFGLIGLTIGLGIGLPLKVKFDAKFIKSANSNSNSKIKKFILLIISNAIPVIMPAFLVGISLIVFVCLLVTQFSPLASLCIIVTTAPSLLYSSVALIGMTCCIAIGLGLKEIFDARYRNYM